MTQVSSQGQAVSFMDKTVDGYTSFFARCNGINGKSGTCVYIAAHENVVFCGLEGNRVCLGSAVAVEFHLGTS